MEFMAEFTEGMSRDRARKLIKGKRTKRQRPCSPFGVLTTSGTTSGDTDGDCFIDNQSPVMSPDISTKEDEDMANCLILLAQSVSPVKDEKSNFDQFRQKTEKLSCRRFSGTTAGEKSGFYPYECKTCNRTFPSFQALGGHRASHKKPKVNVEEKKPNYYSVNNNIIIPPEIMNHVEEEEDHDQQIQQKAVTEDEENKASVIINTSNVQTGIIINQNTKTKVHECSICGSEFISGQALGGHMRKHRPIPVSGNRTAVSVTTTTDDSAGEQTVEKSPSGSNCMLLLDLNFPPPEESKFQFTTSSSQQQQPQQHLVFSSPAFVDCHY